MNRHKAITAAALVATSVVLISGCAKNEPVASSTRQESTATTTAVTTPAPELQPAPGTPVATFTPNSDTPAPMLPTLGSSPSAIDEHSQSPEKAAVRRIAPEEAAMLVQTGDAILVDVRSKDSFDAGHIKGAVSIPYADLSARARAELPPTRWIIPYCT